MSTQHVAIPHAQGQSCSIKAEWEKVLHSHRKILISKAAGVVLEIASGSLQTLSHYAANNATKGIKMIIFSEPSAVSFKAGLDKVTSLIERSDVYTGSYEKVSGIKSATGSDIDVSKFIFTGFKGQVGQDEQVPLNVPCFFIQNPLQGLGSLVRQVLPADCNVNTVVSCFGVCYSCCSVNPLEYLVGIQKIFGPAKSDNTYRLCMLEYTRPANHQARQVHAHAHAHAHGNGHHGPVNGGHGHGPQGSHVAPTPTPTPSPHGAPRHLFELVADSRLIIHDLEHLESNYHDSEGRTFHLYQAEPNEHNFLAQRCMAKTE